MYNNFGLEYYDIVNLFSGLEDDFSTPGKNNGKKNIEDEMDIQLGMLLSKIPATVLRLFEFVEFAVMDQEKTYIDGVGTRFKFPDNLPPVLTGEFTAYYMDENNRCNSSAGNEVLTTGNPTCQNLRLCDAGASVTVSVVSGAPTGYYGITSDIDLTDRTLYVAYEVDSDSSYFEIKELKRYLRDAVACMLGSKMLLQNETDWKLLDIVCENKFEPMKNWVPAEYRALKWWRKPWVDGLITGNFSRS